ncbi:MAG: hypothetical protein ACJ0K4_12155 [Verrucomicrobiales bacterium]
MLLPLLCMSSCSTNSGGPTTVGEAVNMALLAPVILPIAAIHYSVPIEGDKRLRKLSVRGRWYQSREDIPNKPYIEFHGTRGMVLPSHDVGNPSGTVSRGSEIGNRSRGKEDFWEVDNSVHGYHRITSIDFRRHDRYEEKSEMEVWMGATVSGKEMTYWKMVDDKRVDFRLFRE